MTEPNPRHKWIRRLAPWVISAAIVAGLLYKYDLDKIVDHMRDGDTLPLIPFALGIPLGLLFTLALWDLLVLRPTTVGRLSYVDVLRGRAGSSLLLALGYGFSAGGYGVWIGRKTGTDVRSTIGLVIYIMMSDLAAVCIVAGTAVWVSGAELQDSARWTVGVVGPAGAAGLIAFALLAPYTLKRWITEPRTLKAWTEVPAAPYLGNVAGRIVNISIIVIGTWGAMRAFGLDIPISEAAAYMPIIILVGALPINVAGFGAVQAAWLVFESPEAPGEQILAFQFIWNLLVALAILVRGAPFLRGVLREITSGARSAPRDRLGAN